MTGNNRLCGGSVLVLLDDSVSLMLQERKKGGGGEKAPPVNQKMYSYHIRLFIFIIQNTAHIVIYNDS